MRILGKYGLQLSLGQPRVWAAHVAADGNHLRQALLCVVWKPSVRLVCDANLDNLTVGDDVHEAEL
jgi:hypothetical protein